MRYRDEGARPCPSYSCTVDSETSKCGIRRSEAPWQELTLISVIGEARIYRAATLAWAPSRE